jgi:hypothetical protein
MYGSTYNIYFQIYNYLNFYKTQSSPYRKSVNVLKISTKKKEYIKKYMKERYHRKFEITLSPIYE